MKYGVDQCIGDTMGPGGVFRAPAHIPVLLEIAARDARALPAARSCSTTPTPWPCAAGRWARCQRPAVRRPVPRRADHHGPDRQLRRASRRTRSTSSPPASTTWPGSSSSRRTGPGPLPAAARRTSRSPSTTCNEKVRGEVMRHFGYFMTESTGHLSEYLPWFRKNRKALEPVLRRAGLRRRDRRLLQVLRDDRREVPRGSTPCPSSRPRAGAAQRRVLLAHHRGPGDRPALPAQRQRPQRRLHHQPAGRRCVEVPIYVGPHRACIPSRVGNLPPAAGGPQPDQRHGPGARLRRRP